MKKKAVINEVKRMQQLAGILKEGDEPIPSYSFNDGGNSDEEDREREEILDILQDNYGISDAVQEFLGWDEEEAEDADGTYWDDIVDAIMEDPELKAQFLDSEND